MTIKNLNELEDSISYNIQPDEEYDTASIKMITRDGINGILPLKALKDNEKKYFLYETSDLLKLSDIFRETNREKLLYYIKQLVEVLTELEMKKINTKYCILLPDLVFVNTSEKKIQLLLIPIHQIAEQNSTNLQELLKQIIVNSRYDESEELIYEQSSYIEKLLTALNQKSLQLKDFLKLIDTLMKKKETKEKLLEAESKIDEEEEPDSEDIFAIIENYKKSENQENREEKKEQNTESPDTTKNLLHDEYISEILLLSETQENLISEAENKDQYREDIPFASYLLRTKTGERIWLDKDEIIIGKDQSADYYIEGNNAISRKHIIIKKKMDEYTITDNKSKNGTYVNHLKLSPLSEKILKNGAEVRLADEDFIFVCKDESI